jgi:4-aminobutyrate aminotransferase / (S)-3-amino-2-methylpropionate transaminase
MSTRPSRGVRTPLPGPRVQAEIARGGFDMQSIYRASIFDEEKSQGTSLVDLDGNVFLDLFASFALGALGYNHPALVAAARSDAFVRASVNPTSTPFLTAAGWIDFLQELQTRWAPRGMAKVFCVDGGGEGVDAALKAAFIRHGENRREHEGRPRDPLQLPDDEKDDILRNQGTDAVALSFDGAFHGRTLGSLSATHSKVIHKADLPAFAWPSVPFPALRWPLDRYAEENARAETACVNALVDAFEQHAGRVAALIVEPMQAEGGDRHANPSFFRRVQEMAAQAGAALIFDEVQTGTGISGTMWCHEQFDLPRAPDLVTMGKKMQLGGFFATDAYDIRQFGRMYQTKNGDRAKAILALATLHAIEDEHLLEHVRTEGAYFLARLTELADKFPKLVTEPRGRGFLLAFDLPTTAARDELLKKALGRAVFLSYTGTRSVRIRPHLVTSRADIDEAMGVLFAVAREMAG